MIILKCIFAGLITLLTAAIVLSISVGAYLTRRAHLGKNEAIGFDLTFAARSPSVWIIAIMIFGLGFYLQYQRLKTRQYSAARN